MRSSNKCLCGAAAVYKRQRSHCGDLRYDVAKFKLSGKLKKEVRQKIFDQIMLFLRNKISIAPNSMDGLIHF